MTAITAIRRYGRRWLIKLACGHMLITNMERIDREQLFIGKVITCRQCAEEQL